jgi:scavenger receptor class B protein 1
LDNGLKNMLVVDSFDSPGFEAWANSTTSNTPPYYERFYLFNVTNPEAVERGEEKPNLVQVGPYSFLKKQIKFNIR